MAAFSPRESLENHTGKSACATSPGLQQLSLTKLVGLKFARFLLPRYN
jgi:hypothetical protein